MTQDMEQRLAAVEHGLASLQQAQPTLAEFFPHLVETKLKKVSAIEGKRLRFRPVAPEQDVDFILSLRLDEAKNAHLSAVSGDRQAQVDWLKQTDADPGQIYFIIETLEGEAVGTVRIYDIRGASFSWGSWILADTAPKSSAVESTLMIYAFGQAQGFTGAHFEVRRGNERVWQYHERMGAVRVREDAENFYYEMPYTSWRYLFQKYHARLPLGIAIKP